MWIFYNNEKFERRPLTQKMEEEGTPVDIPLFDEIVHRLYYQCGTQAGVEAHEALYKFQQRSDAWIVSQQIVATSQSDNSRFIALKLFSEGAQKYWINLIDEQMQFFKKFYFDLTFSWSNEIANSQLLSAANHVLIVIFEKRMANELAKFYA